MADTGEKLTPMMRQYLDVKKDLPDETILLFRMGDFYELFFEDAEVASRALGIVLTNNMSVELVDNFTGGHLRHKDTWLNWVSAVLSISI